MLIIKNIVRIGITTQLHQLPSWVAFEVTIGGPGFTVGGEKFAWHDYVVKVQENGMTRVIGMTHEEVDQIMRNAETIKNELNL